MKFRKVVTEGDVMVATIRFLFRNGSTPTRISVARGKGIDSALIQEKVKRVFRDESMKLVKPTFVGYGPDIVAVSDDLYWKVECKGRGTGKPATQRNNFDRGLASVVSYYEGRQPMDDERMKKDATSRIALALPASEQYMDLLNKRAGTPLRKQLNLWVLLYRRRKIIPIAPIDDYPDYYP